MLRAEAVRKQFGDVTALDGLSLAISPGEIVGLIGHNGAGKSTFVEIASGLERPDSGSVHIDDIDVERWPRRARAKLGIAPQELGLYPQATAHDNLRLFAGLHGLRGRQVHSRIDQVATAMGLASVLHQRVGLLSGGQQRRLQTATALLHDPPVLLLDEPTVGADVEARRELLAVVRDHADRGAAICYTTHYLAELEPLRATIAVITRGRIIARGAPEELLAGLSAKLVLGFAGRVPAAIAEAVDDSVDNGANAVSITTAAPGEELARILRRFPAVSESLSSVDVVAPTLDDLYDQLLRQASEGAHRHVG
jgi:ABC-2 type transport system ATP-binding protein